MSAPTDRHIVWLWFAVCALQLWLWVDGCHLRQDRADIERLKDEVSRVRACAKNQECDSL